jgi:hypothetical protein
MNELCDFYGIERTNWAALALHLAKAHVPGLRMENAPRGQPSKWGLFERAELRATIDDMIRNHPSGALKPSGAAENLARREPWKSKLAKSKKPADALRKQYEKADPRAVKIWREAAAYQYYEADPEKDLAAAQRHAGIVETGTE